MILMGAMGGRQSNYTLLMIDIRLHIYTVENYIEAITDSLLIYGPEYRLPSEACGRGGFS